VSPHRTWRFVDVLIATVISTVIVGAIGRLLSGDWEVAAGAVVIWLLAMFVILHYLNSRMLRFRRPMSLVEAHQRIGSADREVWSFQISGGEFTANSDDTYSEWLSGDVDRHLRIAFANPENDGLLRSIVKLSGLGEISDEQEALRHLRKIINKSLDRYLALKKTRPDQVDVRVYDCSPPFSIHAVDRRSVYVECYLPNLPARERPCLLLTRNHAYFKLYINQSDAWFQQACPA
jgi:hypothetical protein